MHNAQLGQSAKDIGKPPEPVAQKSKPDDEFSQDRQEGNNSPDFDPFLGKRTSFLKVPARSLGAGRGKLGPPTGELAGGCCNLAAKLGKLGGEPGELGGEPGKLGGGAGLSGGDVGGLGGDFTWPGGTLAVLGGWEAGSVALDHRSGELQRYREFAKLGRSVRQP